MAKFFIERPIVAIVLSIIMVIVGVVSILRLPIAQYPNIVPPEIYINTTYVGADAQTVEQSVATPIEQEMSGVDNMNYMYSLNANNGELKLYVNFDVATDPNIDQVLAQIRKSQADSKIPQDVRNYGVTVKKSQSSPLMIVDLVSPKGTYDATFLANYAYINLNDQLTRILGIASVTVFGAGQYAMRCWVKPDQLAKLNITVPEIVNAIQQQNTVNPAGQVGGEPAPKGQEFTYAIRAQGRLETAEQFGDIVLRANPDGSLVRLKDVARLELGSQTYAMAGRLNGKPSAVLGIYQLPGTNAIAAVDGVKKMLEEAKRSFPPDLEYAIALDTTLAVREGIKEVLKTLYEAMILVIIVVFIFLQGFRATLIPALAVPVSLIATFAFFPFLGFSINTIALMGMVLAIGLVVDDAIVVVEAVEHHIEKGLSPKEATRKAMEEVSGPVIAIALVLSAVFLPSVFIPGITGRLFSQFAVTIAISVMISAFNALTLSPALASMILKPKKHGGGGPLKKFYGWFNNAFGKATNGYVRVCGAAIRKMVISLLLIVIMGIGTGLIGSRVPGGFLPDEDQGYMFAGIQLPDSASLQRTEAAITQMEKIVMATPGVEYCTAVSGYSLLSGVTNTYSGFLWISLKPWEERKSAEEKYETIMAHLNREFAKLPQGVAFAFSPPAIPGIGTSGGVTMALEDRAGKDIGYLWENTQKFMAEARKRPELGRVTTTFIPTVPQVFVGVDRDKVLKQGVDVKDVYQTLQTFMGAYFVNYFNRFGRQWQVYVQAEGEYRTQAGQLGQFYVRNSKGDTVPLSALTNLENRSGPEFTMRYNLYRSAQVNATPAPGYTSVQAMKALEDVFRQLTTEEEGVG